MYKSKKKPKKESPALRFIREKREEQWEQIIKNAPRHLYPTVEENEAFDKAKRKYGIK